MKIDVASLIACGVGPAQAKVFAEPLAFACQRFQIDTAKRLPAFIAQAMHESANFTHMEENLFYSTPERIRQVFPTRVKTLDDAKTLARNPQALANRVYCDRLGNGDEASGEGWMYRGRGIFQLTGKDNYRLASMAINVDYVKAPELVALPEHACLTAAHYWVDSGCNQLADFGDLRSITARINGHAMLGMAQRMDHYMAALEAFK